MWKRSREAAMLIAGMLGCWSCLVALSSIVGPPPIQRPKSMGPPPAVLVPVEPTPVEPTPIEPTPDEPTPDVPALPAAPEPTPPVVTPAPTQPRAPGDPPVLPTEPGSANAPAEPALPPTTSDPFATPGAPPPPFAPLEVGDPTARRTVDPFTDHAPAAPQRDGKALLYGGIAFSAITIAARVPLTARLVRIGNPYDAMVFGNVVNLVAAGAVTTVIIGAIRRGKSVAYTDVFENRERRFNAKAFTATGWTMFGVGLGAFLLSRVFTPLTCDLVNQCSFGGLEATWYVSFALVAAGAGIGTFGMSYGDRARTLEKQRGLALLPWMDRNRAGLGLSGRF